MYNSNAVRKEAVKPRGKVHNIDHTIQKRLVRQRRAFIAKMVIVIVFFCAGGLSIISRHVQVTEQSQRVAALKKDYSELYSENKKTEMSINKKIDLKTVEEVAVAVYGMNRAKKEQIVPIFIDSQDYGIIAKNNGSARRETKKVNALAGLLAYFE